MKFCFKFKQIGKYPSLNRIIVYKIIFLLVIVNLNSISGKRQPCPMLMTPYLEGDVTSFCRWPAEL